MLEFLGMEQEAMSVAIACVLIGIPFGAQVGAMTAYGQSTDDKAKPGQVVFLVICILTGVAGGLMGLWPAVALFFTFQWSYLIGSVFLGVVVAAVSFFLVRAFVLGHRKRKYMRNPIIGEAVAFCKQNGVVGIQCFPDCLRFFTRLEHPDYCKEDIHHEKKEDGASSEQYQKSWRKPEAWAAYDQPASYVGTLTFSQRGYPNVPDLPMFAGALARKLGNFDYAEHNHTVQHETSSLHTNSGIITRHIVVLQHDCFVYSRPACRKAREEWDATHTEYTKTKPVQKPKTWE